MDPKIGDAARWRVAEVTSPGLARPVPVVVADGIPYCRDANRFQKLHVYLPLTTETTTLVGAPVDALPPDAVGAALPRALVHIHGGAWRDPELTASSIEPTVAHAFADLNTHPIRAIASIDYTLSQFPAHPTLPYDAANAQQRDPSREAVHPDHVADALRAFALLRSLGLADDSYVLTGHSCGACIAFQAILRGAAGFCLDDLADAPRPAAILGMNGLYDLPALVDGLDAPHAHLKGEYETLLGFAFGSDRTVLAAASPALFDRAGIAARVRDGSAPSLVMLDQSAQDQLVPIDQPQRLEANLRDIPGLAVRRGHRCSGEHATPWQQGSMIWEGVRDVLAQLQRGGADVAIHAD